MGEESCGASGSPQSRSRRDRPGRTRSAASAPASTSARTSSRGSRKRPSTYAATRSGSVVGGRPTPTRTRAKSADPSPCLSDFRPLWPARPPPSARPDLAEGKVDLVVNDEHVLERHARARREPARPICRRRSCRSGAAGSPPAVRPDRSAPRVSRPRYLDLACGSSQRAASSVGDLEADVVAACPRTRSPGCRARRAASRRERRGDPAVALEPPLLAVGGIAPAGASSAPAASPSAGASPSPTTSVSCFDLRLLLDLEARRGQGGDHGLGIVDQL